MKFGIPIDFNARHSEPLTDWYLSIGVVLFIACIVAGIVAYVRFERSDDEPRWSDEGPGSSLVRWCFGGAFLGILWPAVIVWGLGWTFLEGTRYAIRFPGKRKREREAARVKRTNYIAALEEELDLMPLVEISRSTIDMIKNKINDRKSETP